jgi:excisionase family DNA binding protein
MGTPSPPHLYSVRDACQLLSVSRSTLYALMGTGQLLSLSIGSARRITSSELGKFISDRQQEDYPWNTRDN